MDFKYLLCFPVCIHEAVHVPVEGRSANMLFLMFWVLIKLGLVPRWCYRIGHIRTCPAAECQMCHVMTCDSVCVGAGESVGCQVHWHCLVLVVNYSSIDLPLQLPYKSDVLFVLSSAVLPSLLSKFFMPLMPRPVHFHFSACVRFCLYPFPQTVFVILHLISLLPLDLPQSLVSFPAYSFTLCFSLFVPLSRFFFVFWGGVFFCLIFLSLFCPVFLSYSSQPPSLNPPLSLFFCPSLQHPWRALHNLISPRDPPATTWPSERLLECRQHTPAFQPKRSRPKPWIKPLCLRTLIFSFSLSLSPPHPPPNASP